MNKVFNFSAGPAMLPVEVLNQVQRELFNWRNLKISVMEVSHRSDEFCEIVQDLEYDLRTLLNIPNNYKILFSHGGARAQFSSVPMNLLRTPYFSADYINSGYWSCSAAREAKKYCRTNLIDVTITNGNNIRSIKEMKFWKLSRDSLYVHYCPNETIDGIAIREVPFFDKKIVVVGDFSSTLLSELLDVSRFGLIYASAQKNIGISGLTVIIIRDDLLNCASQQVPSFLKYSILNKYKSLFNTPSTFSWYVAKLVLQWIKTEGGLLKISKQNKEKADLLYETIDSSDYYYNNIGLSNRSYMNVPFYLKDKKLDKIFLQESNKIGLYGLKGHRIVGGMRASLYNAMPLEGVKILSEFMKWFVRKYG